MVVFVTAHVNTKGCKTTRRKWLIDISWLSEYCVSNLLQETDHNNSEKWNYSEMFILFLKTKRYNVSVFLNVNVALIYVVTWRNEKKNNKKSNVSAINYYIDIDIDFLIMKKHTKICELAHIVCAKNYSDHDHGILYTNITWNF